MENLISTQNIGVITLKEITDLIEYRHDRAMQKVDELCKESSFGSVSKIDIAYNGYGQTIPTYLLTKKQAIAISAKLNNSSLMKVIDRLELLESKKQNIFQIPQTFHEALLLAADLEKQNQILLLENHKKSQFISNVVHSDNSYTATQIAKDFNISAKLFNKILLEAGVLYYNNNTYVLASKYQSFNLTTIKETTPNNQDKTFLSLRWTSISKNWLKNNWDKALHRCKQETFDDYNMQLIKNLPSIPATRIKRF